MKTIITLLLLASPALLRAQTMFIDYSERTGENTAAIHIMEAKQTIETEEFNDIITAKTKLIRIIENYRTDGYEVQASNVSTHKHGRNIHYHYQYILQQDTDESETESEKSIGAPVERPERRQRRGGDTKGKADQGGGASMNGKQRSDIMKQKRSSGTPSGSKMAPVK